MRRTFNLKAIAIVLVSLAVLTGCVYAVHRYQKVRNVQAILNQADRARDDKDVAKEYRYLRAYLSLAPRDTDVRVRFARLLHEHARTHHEREYVFFRLEEVVKLVPNDTDLRRKAIQTALAIQRPLDALHHLHELHKQAGSKDAGIEEEIGQVEELRRRNEEADKWFDKALKTDPARVSAYVSRARLWRRRLNRAKDANDLIDLMVAKNPKSAQAQLERVRYLREYTGTERLDELRMVMAGLIERHAVDMPDVLLVAASMEEDGGNVDQARAYLSRGEKLYPKSIDYPRELARLELRAGRSKEALAALRRILDRVPPRGVEYLMAVELTLDAGQKKEARELIAKIRRDESTASLIDYLEAREAFQEERYPEAVKLLDRARADRMVPQELLPAINLLQARCYGQLSNPDQMFHAAERALEQDPLWVPGVIAKADALTALNRPGEALALYESLGTRWPAVRMQAVRLQIARNLAAVSERDWQRPLESLNTLPEGMQKDPEVVALRARALAGKGDIAGAVKLLEAGLKANPKHLNLWLALAGARAIDNKPEQAEEVLDRAVKAVGDTIELRLARIQLAMRQGPAATRRLLEQAETDAEKRPASERALWLRSIGAFYFVQADLDAATRVFTKLTTLRPNDLDGWTRLFDVLYRRNDLERLKPVIKSLRDLEGEEGAYWRLGEALLLLKSDSPADVKRARTWLAEARKRRASWAPPYAIEGQLAEAEGNFDEAVRCYRTAVEHGGANVELVTRLVRLLNHQGNFTEAQSELSRFRQLVSRSNELSRLEVLTALRGGADKEQALALALKSLPEDSRDQRSHILRGQLFWANGKNAEAEKAFRQAVTVAPKQPECYISLVNFLAATDAKKAAAEIETARKALPAEVAPLALAGCYEVIGQRDKAETEYRAAVAATPEAPAALRAIAAFYLRLGRLNNAEPYFRKLMAMKGRQGEPHAAWARRCLAIGMAATGDFQRSQQALALLEENFKGRTPTAEDQRTRALILARRPGDRREAIKALESSFARALPTPDEEFFLATLLIADQRWDLGQERLLRLLTSRGGNNPVYLVYYLQQLLERNDLGGADRWLAQLEKVEPGSMRTVGIKARILHARKESKEAHALLKQHAATHAKDPGQQLGVARVLESLGFVAEAEPYYRVVAKALQEKQPVALVPLIGYLGRRNRVSEALSLCEKVNGRVPDAQLVDVWVGVLREGQATEEHCKRVEEWLQAAKKKTPTDPIFDLGLANVKDLQAKTAEAARIYQAILEKDDRNLIAYNNLAVLLALREGKGDEALAKIERALQLAGPQPELLDSRAIIYLSMGQTKRAIADLEVVVQMTPDPASYFRLASAYLKVNDQRSARQAWQKARAGGFKLTDLHPLERPQGKQALAALE